MVKIAAPPATRRAPVARQAPTATPPAPVVEVALPPVEPTAATLFETSDGRPASVTIQPSGTPVTTTARAAWKPISLRWADTFEAAVRLMRRMPPDAASIRDARTTEVLASKVAWLRAHPDWKPAPRGPVAIECADAVVLRPEYVKRYAAASDDPADLAKLTVVRTVPETKSAVVATASGLRMVVPLAGLKLVTS